MHSFQLIFFMPTTRKNLVFFLKNSPIFKICRSSLKTHEPEVGVTIMICEVWYPKINSFFIIYQGVIFCIFCAGRHGVAPLGGFTSTFSRFNFFDVLLSEWVSEEKKPPSKKTIESRCRTMELLKKIIWKRKDLGSLHN